MPEAGGPAAVPAAATAALAERLRTLAAATPSGRIAVALSGGLDSRFLVHMALRSGVGVLALHVAGPHIPAREHAFAVRWANSVAAPLTVVTCDPLALPALAHNPKDRCYHCKKTLFTALKAAAKDLPLCDGTNLSDSGEYRPGRAALHELGIHSPLAEAGLDKTGIREIAAATGMENPEQAAMPCLLTRFGYGSHLTSALLRAVDAAEEAVDAVFALHGRHNAAFRLRYENAQTPALHLAGAPLPEALVADIRTALAATGFAGIPLRFLTRLSGYFDRDAEPHETGA